MVPQPWRQVSKVNIRNQRDESIIGIRLVVFKLAVLKGSRHPPVKGRQKGHTHGALGSDMPDQRLRLEFSIKETGDWEIQRKYHSQKGGPVIQTRSKVPLPHATAIGAQHWRCSQKWSMKDLEKSTVHIPNEKNDQCHDSHFASNKPFGMVV